MSKLTDEQIRELCEKATANLVYDERVRCVGVYPAPYVNCMNEAERKMVHYVDGIWVDDPTTPCRHWEVDTQKADDARLFAHARGIILHLLQRAQDAEDEHYRLRAQVQRLQRVGKRLVADKRHLRVMVHEAKEERDRLQARVQELEKMIASDECLEITGGCRRLEKLRQRRDRWRTRAETAAAKLQEAFQVSGKTITDMHNQRVEERRRHEIELDDLRERVQAAEQARNQALQTLAIAEERNQELERKVDVEKNWGQQVERQYKCMQGERDALIALVGHVQQIASHYASMGMMINPDWLLAHTQSPDTTVRGVQQYSTSQIVVLNGERGEVVALEALDEALLVTARLQRNWKGGEPSA